jgi:hypothetical protein
LRNAPYAHIESRCRLKRPCSVFRVPGTPPHCQTPFHSPGIHTPIRRHSPRHLNHPRAPRVHTCARSCLSRQPAGLDWADEGEMIHKIGLIRFSTDEQAEIRDLDAPQNNNNVMGQAGGRRRKTSRRHKQRVQRKSRRLRR